jgi:hypothetical protein
MGLSGCPSTSVVYGVQSGRKTGQFESRTRAGSGLERPWQRKMEIRSELGLLIAYQRSTAFVGREADLEALRSWVLSELPTSVRVVTGDGDPEGPAWRSNYAAGSQALLPTAGTADSGRSDRSNVSQRCRIFLAGGRASPAQLRAVEAGTRPGKNCTRGFPIDSLSDCERASGSGDR